jgi:deazaflavin-dependent oxidoreductase (nitroreductase family)
MAFDKTPNGSYGQQMPPFAKPLSKVINPVMTWRARRSTGPTMGLDLLVLTTTGAKTGQRRETVLGYFPDGEAKGDSWLIVASAGGSAANPAWYHNLAAHPGKAEIEVGGRKVAVTATQLSGDEREAAWQRIIAASPRYTGYATKTDRQIPVIRLTAAQHLLAEQQPKSRDRIDCQYLSLVLIHIRSHFGGHHVLAVRYRRDLAGLPGARARTGSRTRVGCRVH